jgi:hypothetical protein
MDGFVFRRGLGIMLKYAYVLVAGLLLRLTASHVRPWSWSFMSQSLLIMTVHLTAATLRSILREIVEDSHERRWQDAGALVVRHL